LPERVKQAFGILVERYQKQIFSLAYRLSGDYDEAQDMAQEAFLHIYNQLTKFDLNCKFFPWVYRLAHNSCVNFIIRKNKTNSTSLDDIIEIAPVSLSQEKNPEAMFVKKEEEVLLYEVLRDLPDHFRMPLFLKYIEGFSYHEISDRLGLPVSTVEARLFRGRKLLKQRLGQVLSKESKELK